ncbi:hypothetical protein SVIOM74S_03667 [Streptomyces violarus]
MLNMRWSRRLPEAATRTVWKSKSCLFTVSQSPAASAESIALTFLSSCSKASSDLPEAMMDWAAADSNAVRAR